MDKKGDFMVCPKCNANNMDGSSFCVKCGADLRVAPQQVTASEPAQVNVSEPVQNNMGGVYEAPVNNVQYSAPAPQPTYNAQAAYASNGPTNFFAYMFAVLVNPVKAYESKKDSLSETKTSLVFGGIIVGIMTLVKLLTSMISVIFTKTFDFKSLSYKSTISFSNLKNIKYFDVIFKNLLIYAGVVAGVALCYFILSLIFKKALSFGKSLAITATSAVPYVVGAMIVSPIVGKIWAPLSVVFMVVGAIYTLLIFITLMDEEFNDSNAKIFVHLIGLSILGVALYYLYINSLTSAVSTGLNSILNMFK